MYSISAAGKTLEGYEAVAYPTRRDGDMRPLLHDAARVVLSDSGLEFALGFRRSKNLLGKEVKFADVVDLATCESFSVPAETVFLAAVIGGDFKLMAKIGEEIVTYANFGRTEYRIEPDGDKAELTPLGYYDTFVRYVPGDDEFYYPLMFDPKIAAQADVKRFYDYYGWRARTGRGGDRHFVLLYEDETSTDARWVWYFCDNFKRCSERVDFGDESEVETWDLDPNGVIRMLTTENKKFHIDAQGRTVPGWPESYAASNEFAYERLFEDTDSDWIVGRNANGLFVIGRNASTLTDKEAESIAYFTKLLAVRKDRDDPLFVFEDSDGIVSIADKSGSVLVATDIPTGSRVTGITADRTDGEVRIAVEGEAVPRRYAI